MTERHGWKYRAIVTVLLTAAMSFAATALKDTREATLADVQQNQRLEQLEDRYKQLYDADIRIENKIDLILARQRQGR